MSGLKAEVETIQAKLKKKIYNNPENLEIVEEAEHVDGFEDLRKLNKEHPTA